MADLAEEITAAVINVINAIVVAEPGPSAAEVDKRWLFPHPQDPKPCMELPHLLQPIPPLLNMVPQPLHYLVTGPLPPVTGPQSPMNFHPMVLETGGHQLPMRFLSTSLEAGELNITYTSHV